MAGHSIISVALYQGTLSPLKGHFSHNRQTVTLWQGFQPGHPQRDVINTIRFHTVTEFFEN